MTTSSRRDLCPRTAGRVLVAMGVFLLIVALAIGTPVTAQVDGRTLTVTPNRELTHGQYVDAAWAGLSGRAAVRIRLCPASATKVEDCAQSSPSLREPGDSKVGISGARGEGSVPFVIRAGDVVPISGADPFFCDATHACRLAMLEIESGGSEDFSKGVFVDLEYSASTVPCPIGGDRIAGSGGSSVRGAMTQWQSEVCGAPHNLDVSFIISNSVQGNEAFVAGLPDSEFSVSGLPLTDDDVKHLAQRGITPRYAPISAGSLVFVYNLWYDRDGDGRKEQVKDLQLSPATLAGIMQGRITTWNDPVILGDNPTHTFPVKQVKVVGRADNSAATFWMTTWMWETARDAWLAGGPAFASGPTAIFPAGNGIILRTGTDAVAEYVRKFPGEFTDENADVPRAGFIGFVYNSEAQKLGLPVAALRNSSGAYVKPNDETLTAAFSAGSLSEAGVFTPNFTTTDPKAYPLPIVSYLIAATGTDRDVDPTSAAALGKFLSYALGIGQDQASERGYIPLPANIKAAAQTGAAEIAKQPQLPSTPTPTPVPTAAPLSGAVTPQAQAPGQTTTVVATAAPATSVANSSSGPPAASRSSTATATDTTTDSSSGATPVEAVGRAIAGVIGIGAIGSVPIGMPALVVFAIGALLSGRLLLNRAQRRAMGGPSELRGTNPLAARLERILSSGGTP